MPHLTPGIPACARLLLPLGLSLALASATWAASPAPQTSLEQARILTQQAEKSADAAVPDDVSAIGNFREAASLGDPRAKLRLAQFLIQGRGTARDVDGGLKLLRELGASGDGNAFLLLGDVLAGDLAGPGHGAEAIAAYEQAAAHGRSLALVKLGQIYQEGKIAAANPQKAVDSYLAAIAAGRTAAMIPLGKSLAEGKFASYGTRQDGIKLLQQAEERGVAAAAIALSDCYFNGMGVARSSAKALTILRTAWESGNVEAGRRLVALYRDGRKAAVVRNRAKALTYYAQVRDKLDPHAQKLEALLLSASASRHGGYFDVQRQLLDLRPADRPSAVRKLRSVNANAFVYVVQSRLGGLGYFKGSASGTLTTATLRAIRKYCGARNAREACNGGPLTLSATELLASAF